MVVLRSLYREVGQRNAKTVTAVSVRAGVVEEVGLPGAAQARADQRQQGTAREAEATARVLGRLSRFKSRALTASLYHTRRGGKPSQSR